MNKSRIILPILFAISTCSHANTIQRTDYESPVDAAETLTPNAVVPTTPPQGTQNNPESGANCTNPPSDAIPDVDVPSISGSAPAQGA